MSAILLLLDEDVRPLLAETLRARGYDAVHVSERGLSGRTDPEVLDAAIGEQRALLTHNVADFVQLAHELARSGKVHSGIVLSAQMPFRDLLARTLRLFAGQQAEQLRNTVVWLP